MGDAGEVKAIAVGSCDLCIDGQNGRSRVEASSSLHPTRLYQVSLIPAFYALLA